jgi:hypothetical protein
MINNFLKKDKLIVSPKIILDTNISRAVQDESEKKLSRQSAMQSLAAYSSLIREENSIMYQSDEHSVGNSINYHKINLLTGGQGKSRITNKKKINKQLHKLINTKKKN